MKTPKLLINSNKSLINQICEWLIEEKKRYYNKKRISVQIRQEMESRAKVIIEQSSKNGSLRVLEKNGTFLCLLGIIPALQPRVKNQKSLILLYSKKHLNISRNWLKKQISDLAKAAPKYTGLALFPEEDYLFNRYSNKSGFHARYEILTGQTNTALKNLIQARNPPITLDHLGLELRRINKKSELPEVMSLQKHVSLGSKTHGYFSHSPSQLKLDLEEYKNIIDSNSGIILGVFKKHKLAGLMISSIHKSGIRPTKVGGLSFYFSPSIQGKGVSKTGYRILLQFLKDNKVKSFYGGTSQPAIQALGKIMKRKVSMILYLKMHKSLN